MTQGTDFATRLLPGALAISVIVAAALALAVSLGLLALYRRAVLRSMGTRGGDGVPASAPLDGSTAPDTPVRTALDVVDHHSSVPTEPKAAGLHSELLRAPWRTAVVYAVAGSGYALVMAAVWSARANGFVPHRTLLLLCVFAWPVVLTVNLVAATSWRTRATTAVVYFLVLAVVGALAVALSSEFGGGQVLLLWILVNLPTTALLMVFLNRRVRAVGPLVLSFMFLAVVGCNLALFAVAPDEGFFDLVFGVTSSLGLSSTFLTAAIVLGTAIALGLSVFALAGWLALRWIGHRYERKKLSDQSITLDAIWLMFALSSSVLLVFEGVAWMLFGLVVGFGVYKLVARGGLSLLRRRSSPDPRESRGLLVLRVFSLGKRSEQMFDALTTHWRHAGDVRLIAGPDLATTTIEPHEFLDFLSRRLDRRFIDGDSALDVRLSEMDVEADRDGRFRVNDFFCHEDTWQMVLSRLVSESDAVLMDLRGFSPQNAGVVFEIQELINVVSVDRVVFIVDETTDEQLLRQTLRQSWESMRPTSPNHLDRSGAIRLFRFRGSRRAELQELLRTLSTAATAPEPATGAVAAP